MCSTRCPHRHKLRQQCYLLYIWLPHTVTFNPYLYVEDSWNCTFMSFLLQHRVFYDTVVVFSVESYCRVHIAWNVCATIVESQLNSHSPTTLFVRSSFIHPLSNIICNLNIFLAIVLGLSKEICLLLPEKTWLVRTVQMKISKDIYARHPATDWLFTQWEKRFLGNCSSRGQKGSQFCFLMELHDNCSVMRVRSDTFGDPIFQKGLQN